MGEEEEAAGAALGPGSASLCSGVLLPHPPLPHWPEHVSRPPRAGGWQPTMYVEGGTDVSENGPVDFLPVTPSLFVVI